MVKVREFKLNYDNGNTASETVITAGSWAEYTMQATERMTKNCSPKTTAVFCDSCKLMYIKTNPVSMEDEIFVGLLIGSEGDSTVRDFKA